MSPKTITAVLSVSVDGENMWWEKFSKNLVVIWNESGIYYPKYNHKIFKNQCKDIWTNYLSSQQKIWMCRYPTKKPKATATSTIHIPGSTVYRLRTTDLKQYFEKSIIRGSVPHLPSLKIMIKWKWSRSVVSDSLWSHGL